MPPEPLPWDRKDLLRDRKHDRSESSLGSFSRWREASHHGPPSREFGRWGSSEFRSRPPGHSKQGVWHVHSEESDHVLTPSRCNEKIGDGENSRPSGHNRGDGRHNRSSSSSRDNNNNRGSFISQKEYSNNNNKGHSWEADVSPNGPSRSNGMTDQRSVDNMVMENSHPHSDDFVSSSDQFNLKEQQQQQDNKNGGGGGANGLGTGRKVDKESSLGSTEWKLSHKWTRSGSLSSRGSSFSQSGSSKSLGVDSSEAKNEVQIKALTPLQSPSGETGACVTSAALFEDPNCRKKKPRLGWGEGLAKYEKKKVEGPDDSIVAAKPVLFVCTTDPLDPHMLDQSEKSPVIPSAIDPATPSSVGCSSSSGREDKPFTVTSNIENETNNFCSPADITMESYLERIPFNLENLDLASISNLSTSLAELLQDESTSPTDSSFVRCTAINKLLVLKRDVSKELEITESEIDLLETELKCQSLPAAAASNDLFDHQETPGDDQLVTFPNLILEATPLNLVPCAQEGEAAELKDGYGDDSPGRITTNYTLKADGEDRDLQDLGVQLVSACDVNTLVALNNDIAKNATQEFEIPSPPAGPSNVDPARETGNSSGVQNDDLTMIRDKIMERKHFLKFQERAVALKYRVFQRMWKEDMQLLSARKNRAKSQKRQELCLRAQNGIFQKHRSSTRVRFSSPAGSASVVPSSEVISFTSKLLSEPQPKVYRNTLKMPPLILDKKERIATRFVSSNGLLEDPCGAEEERALINPWTLEERKIFVDKFAEFGKDFKKISSFLDHKTVAACVEFYYKNHKSDWFAIKKKNKPEFPAEGKPSASSNYLVTSGKQLNHERNASSLHMLGAVSALVANADNNGVEIQHRRPSSQLLLLSKESAKPRFDDGNDEGPSSPEILDRDRETAAADVLAGICGSMTSCVTSSFTPGENNHHRVLKKSSLTVEVMHSQDDDDDSCSDESCEEEETTNQVDWTDEEKSNFVQAVSCYGKDFSMVSQQVRTKSRDQCRLFFSKARKCLGLKGVCHPTAIPMEEDESKAGQIVSDLNTLPCEKSSLQAVVPEEENGHEKRQHELVEVGNSETQVGNTRDSQEELLQSQKGGIENRNCELNVSMKTDLNCVMDDDLSVIGGVLSHMDRDVSVQVDINNKQLQKKMKTGLVQLNQDNFPVAAANSVPSHQNKTFNPDLLSNRADPLQDCLLQKCTSSSKTCAASVAELPPFPPPKQVNENQGSRKVVACGGGSSSDLEKPPMRNGDIKLFGQILKHPSPKHENEEKRARLNGSLFDLKSTPAAASLNGSLFDLKSTPAAASLNGSLFDLKSIPAAASLNGSLFDLKSTPAAASPVVVDARPLKGKVIEGKNYMGSENASVRSSYSFLDGNRIQSGFSSCLPDSAILLAKYPAAFVNLSSSSSNIEQQTMPMPPPFETKNELSHHHLYSRSQQQQGGSSRGEKSQQEILLTEMRMLNGYEAAPSIAQQQARMMMMAGGGINGGMNMGSVLSDPVAALKMHYGSGVKEQKKNGHIGTHHNTREEEPWRGNNGDIGR
ncbi:uncharacterized protein LOC124937602 [Impatiens glandulifera]|uniref:uncharacterized protein LOC124937602 n=1 Tax=Impatiens glandulifera TaxID=253017 RepID=UPI001FB1926E|nr:uncharacterized protein LOC124937602 [Impatiens glandulifera]